METCKYKFRNGENCKEKPWQNSEFCILHIDLPEDESSEEFRGIHKSKKKKVEEKVSKEDFNFEGARLLYVDFSGMKIKRDLNFTDAVIRRDASFDRANIIGRNAGFDGATIGGNASFDRTKIGGKLEFKGTNFQKPNSTRRSMQNSKKYLGKIGRQR